MCLKCMVFTFKRLQSVPFGPVNEINNMFIMHDIHIHNTTAHALWFSKLKLTMRL